MTDCPFTDCCQFFNDEMGDKPNLVTNSFKIRFCKGTYLRCARWIVMELIGSSDVPKDLYPNQDDRIDGIVEAQGKQ